MNMSKKQRINIHGKAANQRIERAIPRFQGDGMSKAQATAVAIRLESVGQLGMGGAIKTGAALSPAIFATAMLRKDRQPKKTIQRNGELVKAVSGAQLRRKMKGKKTTKPKRKK